jgi:hypothetical protein
MKPTHWLLAGLLLALPACTTTIVDTSPVPGAPVPVRPARIKPFKDTPETVIVTYHVLPGREAEFPKLLDHAWGIYRQEHLVNPEPHVIVRDQEADGKTKFVEIFTWVSHAGPAHAPASVLAVWNEEMAICEPRNGHPGLEGGEVQLIKP